MMLRTRLVALALVTVLWAPAIAQKSQLGYYRLPAISGG